jgi:hypothetical protein
MSEVKVGVSAGPGADKDDHGSDVVWAAAPTKVPDDLLTKWSSSADPSGPGHVIHVQGPCPECELATSGLLAVEISGPVEPGVVRGKEERMTTVPRSWRVPVTCNCGYSHGKEGATGCGRMWFVVCAEAGT